MSRFNRIQVIWRKELIDTLRDRRTLIAMVIVPIVLYPALMLGSLQGVELQLSRMKQEQYRVVVDSPEVAAWLRQVIDTDPARRPGSSGLPAEELVSREAAGELPAEANEPAAVRQSTDQAARSDVRRQPPKYVVDVVADASQAEAEVKAGQAHVGLTITGGLPSATGEGTSQIALIADQTDIRSYQMAAAGLEAILERADQFLLRERLARATLPESFVQPIQIHTQSIASPEKVGGSLLGHIVPLILIVMTITGAIYPAIDLTAGERERGTLETLMVAPVPAVDLIAGKFLVVTMVGMLSAALNLLSIGGTIWLGGLGDVLMPGGTVVIPLSVLPWVLLLLVPLAVLFSAVLLAVCSFARSFKEAQNYVMPVMVAAMIPAVIGILPGTRLEGPLLIVPVTNISILTRDLFTGRVDLGAIVWVTASTTLYAAAAVAVAARLFGQEAVLFADSGSLKTLLRRRFFRPVDHPTASQALLLLAVVFVVNFFAQQALLKAVSNIGGLAFWACWTGVIVALFVVLPAALAGYVRADLRSTFALRRPPPAGLLAALCFGLSTWILGRVVFVVQNRWLPMPTEMEQAFQKLGEELNNVPPGLAFVFLALVPAICEELFFRGYALSGIRSALGKTWAVLLVAAAFGLHHHSIFRLAITASLGILFGMLVVQYRSIWPAMLAHCLHNGLGVLSDRQDALQPWLERIGCVMNADGLPPAPWMFGAAALTALGVLICLLAPARADSLENRALIRQDRGVGVPGEP